MTVLSVLRDPTLRLVVLALLLVGAVNASVYPYQSLVGIERIGLSEGAFAAVLVVASLVSVSSALLLGILSDQKADRRRVALFTTGCGVAGVGLMLLAPSPVTFALCHGVLFPVYASLYGQLFALVRLARSDDGAVRDAMLSTIRSALSLSFLGTLVFWTLAFGQGLDVMAVYVTACAAGVILAVLLVLRWPRDGQTAWEDRPSGLNLARAMQEVARPHILIRLLLLGAIASAGNLYMILAALVFDASPLRDAGTTALYVGLVAGWEVPFMLLMPLVMHRFRRATLIAVGTAVYVAHLALMPVLVDTAWLWLLPLLAGLGGTAILTLPIAYYQDLLAGRPGTAGSMLALQRLVSELLAALSFAGGSLIGGHAATAVLGAGVALTGAGLLWVIDRAR